MWDLWASMTLRKEPWGGRESRTKAQTPEGFDQEQEWQEGQGQVSQACYRHQTCPPGT